MTSGCVLLSHDIKTGIFPMQILRSFYEYKKHTILGYSALDEESWIAPISMKMVLSHHENMAGTGFPIKQKNKGTGMQNNSGM